jgi:hypothetical protein
MEKTYANLRSGLILLALSIPAYFWLIPAQIRIRELDGLGPEFFPRLMVICCGLCAAGMVIQGLVGLGKAGALRLATFTNSEYRIKLVKYVPHLLFLLVALAYLLVMPYSGFVIASVPFLTFLLWFFGHSKIHWCVLIASVSVAVIYLVFTYAFKVSFPQGPLGF